MLSYSAAALPPAAPEGPVAELAVRMPTMAPPNLPATAQMLPESKRRFSDELLRRPPKTGDPERGRSGWLIAEFGTRATLSASVPISIAQKVSGISFRSAP